MDGTSLEVVSKAGAEVIVIGGAEANTSAAIVKAAAIGVAAAKANGAGAERKAPLGMEVPRARKCSITMVHIASENIPHVRFHLAMLTRIAVCIIAERIESRQVIHVYCRCFAICAH
jgi:hypothetical protein